MKRTTQTKIICPSVGGWFTSPAPTAVTASQPLTCSSTCPASWRVREALEANPVCWCSHLGKKASWTAWYSLIQLGTEKSGLTISVSLENNIKQYSVVTYSVVCVLTLQIHRCSGCGPSCAFPPRPSCPSMLHHRCRNCLCGPPHFLYGAQVRSCVASKFGQASTGQEKRISA